VIVLAVRNPYDLQAFPDARTFIATYEYTRPALEAAARVIFGVY
jgi:beta-N-acetylhexosaminidase